MVAAGDDALLSLGARRLSAQRFQQRPSCLRVFALRLSAAPHDILRQEGRGKKSEGTKVLQQRVLEKGQSIGKAKGEWVMRWCAWKLAASDGKGGGTRICFQSMQVPDSA
eukprot:1884216-Rhodomonas_salina.1